MKKKGFDWNKENIVILPVEGKYNIKTLYTIFDLFNIPTYIIFDGDIHNKGTDDASNSRKANKILMRIIGKENELVNGFPNETKAYEKGTIFLDKIEDEIKISLDDLREGLYDEITKEIGDKYGKLGKKNAYKAYLIIKKAYDLEISIPILDNIIDKIMQFYNSNIN